MKAKDGVYTGFLILEEKDILELKHMIKNYKPISQNDIAFLHHKLEKKGKAHLVKFFEKHIMGKSGSQKHVETSQPKKREKPSIETEVYQTKTYKASDFQFLQKQIRVRKYILKTERAFALPTSLLQKIQGEFTVRIRPDKTFYFENHGLTKLLDSVENYCYSYLDTACEAWFREELDSIEKDVIRHICLNFKDFTFNETSRKYELKDDAIKYSILSNWILKYNFQDFVDKRTNIPQRYRNTYKCNYRFAKQVEKFNKEFEKSLTDILRKYVYYTEKDLEVIKWHGENYYKPSIFIDFKLTDEDTCKGITEWIRINSCLYFQQIEIDIKNAPQGALYDFGDKTISSIEDIVDSLKEDSAYDMFKAYIESVKTRKTIKYETDKYIANYSTTCSYDTAYSYRVSNPLLDISDNHYRIGHPKLDDYKYKLQNGIIHKIAYFIDQNKMYSQEWPGSKCVDCYLLANDEYIALYALDSSKSTYVFKVKKECVDIAMFFIWAYFSSSMYNKREGKSLRVERLFSRFGIEWYDNTGSHISKNEEKLYQFILPYCFYSNI